jgi:putative redox protein
VNRRAVTQYYICLPLARIRAGASRHRASIRPEYSIAIRAFYGGTAASCPDCSEPVVAYVRNVGMNATARRAGDGHRCEIDVNGRHQLVTDEPVALGGGDAGPAPHELLPAALASCIATMISMYGETKGWDVRPVAVEVDYDQKSVPRRFEITLRLPDSLTRAQLARLRRVADSCPLRRALEAGFEFDEQIVPESHRQAA